MIFEILAFLVFLKFCLVYTNGWCKSKVCLVGKTAIITGGNSGLGLETARTLASRGCKIIIADKDNAESTVKALQKETHNPNITSLQVDFSSFKSVREFAKTINSTVERLHILINNAGIGDVSYEITDDGLQRIMQVNYFGHFLLVHLLADLLKKSAPSRVLHASSVMAYIFPSLTTKNIKGEIPSKSPIYSSKTYGNSKLCLAIASKIFAKKFEGTGVTSNCFHPGVVKTDIYIRAANASKNPVAKFVYFGLHYLVLFFGKTVEEGTQTMLYLAMADEVEQFTGNFFVETSVFWQPVQVNDDEFCKEIWRLSEEIVGLKPEEKLSLICE